MFHGGGMDLQALATTAAAIFGVKTGLEAKKTAQHAKERARGKEMEMEAESIDQTRALKASAKTARRKRLSGYERNKTLFNPEGLAGQAETIRKTLLGQ